MTKNKKSGRQDTAMRTFATAAALALLLSASSAHAAGGDITTKVYRSQSTGGTTTVITNREARNESLNIDRFRSGKTTSYPKYSPPKASDQGGLESRSRGGAYSGGGSLGQIIVTLKDGSELDIAPIIILESRRNNVDPWLIRTIIKYESGFYPYAVSPVGAGGLMQLMPDTARGLGVTDIFSPHQNIAGGTLYIRRQLDAFGNNVAFALAAYNAGPGAVISYGGVPPYAETVNYVNMIMADYKKGASGAVRPEKTVEKAEPEKRSVDVYTTLDRMRTLTAPRKDGEQ